MDKYVCSICGEVYDPAEGYPQYGIAPAVSFDDLPGDFICPMCGASKEEFEKK